jgi:rubredoxin
MPTVLPDCCEDWILQYGPFYAAGVDFACPECGAGWRKEGPGAFRRIEDQRRFVRRERSGEDTVFPYLAAEDGENPLVERCCAGILLRYGPALPYAELRCPVCGTVWTKSLGQRGGVRFPQFQKAGAAEPMTIQRGRQRAFLVPVSEFSPPRE